LERVLLSMRVCKGCPQLRVLLPQVADQLMRQFQTVPQ